MAMGLKTQVICELLSYCFREKQTSSTAPIVTYLKKALQPNITSLVQKHFQQFESAFADITSTYKHRFFKKP